MANPPAVVKLALESVCELLNESATDWKAIRGILVKDSFISSIVNLETDKITYAILSLSRTHIFTNTHRIQTHSSVLIRYRTVHIIIAYINMYITQLNNN